MTDREVSEFCIILALSCATQYWLKQRLLVILAESRMKGTFGISSAHTNQIERKQNEGKEMKTRALGLGLLTLVFSGIAAPAFADPYLGEWRYSEVRHDHRRAMNQRREAAIDLMEGRYGAARYHERKAIHAQREARYDRLGGW